MSILNENYYLRLFKSKTFKSSPVSVLFRGVSLMFLLVFKKPKVITIPFGVDKFKFNYVPLGKHKGGRGLYLYRNKIESLMEFGHKFLEKGNVVIDGGANQGIYTSAFSAAVGKSGKVISIEPFDYCHKMIKNNLELNMLHNVTAFQNVLSDQIGEYTLDFSGGVGTSSIVRNMGGDKTTTVEAVTIQSIVEKLDLKRLDFIKLDVEGAEFIALKGGIEVIEKNKPAIVLECDHSQYAEINDLLNPFGYKPFVITDEGKLEQIRTMTEFEENLYFLCENHQIKYNS